MPDIVDDNIGKPREKEARNVLRKKKAQNWNLNAEKNQCRHAVAELRRNI